jgi:hypothetical protein
VLIVWSLDRIVRLGAEDALRIFRQFRERGCVLVSVKESWLNGSPEAEYRLGREAVAGYRLGQVAGIPAGPGSGWRGCPGRMA